jgi:hypothetical protein
LGSLLEIVINLIENGHATIINDFWNIFNSRLMKFVDEIGVVGFGQVFVNFACVFLAVLSLEIEYETKTALANDRSHLVRSVA